MAICPYRFESEYKDYVQKAIFLRDEADTEVEMSALNDVIIIENSVKVEQIDEDSNTSTICVDEQTVSAEQQLVNEFNGQYPVKTENDDEHLEMNQSKVDRTAIEARESKSIAWSKEECLTDFNTTALNHQLKSNVENSSGIESTDILDKSCPKYQKGPSIANYQLNRSKSHEVKGSHNINEPTTNEMFKKSDKVLAPQNALDNSQNIRLESKRTQSSNNKKPTNNLKDIMFYCSHCAFNEPNPEPYNSLKAFLNHCSNSHVKKPVPTFSFHVGTNHRCIICPTPNTISESFRRSIQHFQSRHHDKQFFVTDQRDDKKCSICEFKNGDLAEHFKLHHPFVTNAFVFDPIRLNKNGLDELIQMQKCEKCFGAFVSKQEASNHKCEQSNEETKFQKLCQKNITTILCGECNEETHDENEFITHFKGHTFKNDATLGNSYYKTKYLYGNGLIVHKYNLLDKNDNENEIIEKIVHDLHMKTENGTNGTNKQGGSKNPMGTKDNEPRTENSAISTNEINIDRELRLQRKELNKLIVYGISKFARFQSEEFLREEFFELCGKIDLDVKYDDVKSKRHKSLGITVELKSTELKDQILNKVESYGNFVPESKIKMVPKLTEYYQTLSKRARKMIAKKQIFRERICAYGLEIQVHRNSNTVQYVNSIEELDQFCNAQYGNGKRGSGQSPQTPPKRSRNFF